MLFGALLFVAFITAVAIGTRIKGKLGINLKRVTCPHCGMRLPIVRFPANLRQTLWGGGTCSCGCDVDKWGREIAS